MDRAAILDFIRANPNAVLCTVEDGKPHGRGMETFRADEDGLIFYTGKYKDVYKQIEKNPEVELCYIQGIQVRVSGRMEMVDDLGLKKELVAERPLMKSFVENQGYEPLALLRLKGGKATIWKASDRGGPKTYVDL